MSESHALDFDAIAVGDQLPEFVRTTGFAEWNRYAAVNDEFVPIHMDDEDGRAAGYPGAIGMGRLQWSYLHSALRQWLAGDGRIVGLQVQFRGPNLRDEPVHVRGSVTAVTDAPGGRMIELELRVETGEGRVLAPGSATVELSS